MQAAGLAGPRRRPRRRADDWPGRRRQQRGGGGGGGGRGLGGGLALRAEALQVPDQPETERVLDVESLDADQVAGDLGGALAEPDEAAVERQRRRVDVVAGSGRCIRKTNPSDYFIYSTNGA